MLKRAAILRRRGRTCAGYENVIVIRKSRSISNLIRNLMATLFYLFRIVKHDKYLLCNMFVQSIGYRRVYKLILFILFYFILPIAAFL